MQISASRQLNLVNENVVKELLNEMDLRLLHLKIESLLTYILKTFGYENHGN